MASSATSASRTSSTTSPPDAGAGPPVASAAALSIPGTGTRTDRGEGSNPGPGTRTDRGEGGITCSSSSRKADLGPRLATGQAQYPPIRPASPRPSASTRTLLEDRGVAVLDGRAAGAPAVSLSGRASGRLPVGFPDPSRGSSQAAAVPLGSSFALMRSSLDRSTEGVHAPRCLLRLGIDNMVDLADCFDDGQELLAALSAADQQEQALALQAWTQSRRRCDALARLRTPVTALPAPAITPATTYHITPAPAPTPPDPPPPPPPATHFEPSSETADCSRVAARDKEVAAVLQGHVGRLVQG